MMTNRFEDLWNSADDGASSPIGPLGFHGEAEFDGLLDAWYVERQHSIEFEILLDQSKKMIRRLLAEGDLSPESQRSARRLIRAITETLRTAESDRD
jgi:hypothetical protein